MRWFKKYTSDFFNASGSLRVIFLTAAFSPAAAFFWPGKVQERMRSWKVVNFRLRLSRSISSMSAVYFCLPGLDTAIPAGQGDAAGHIDLHGLGLDGPFPALDLDVSLAVHVIEIIAVEKIIALDLQQFLGREAKGQSPQEEKRALFIETLI